MKIQRKEHYIQNKSWNLKITRKITKLSKPEVLARFWISKDLILLVRSGFGLLPGVDWTYSMYSYFLSPEWWKMWPYMLEWCFKGYFLYSLLLGTLFVLFKTKWIGGNLFGINMLFHDFHLSYRLLFMKLSLLGTNSGAIVLFRLFDVIYV